MSDEQIVCVLKAQCAFSPFRFRQECKAAGKKLMVWTVNKPEHMMEVWIIVLRLVLRF